MSAARWSTCPTCGAQTLGSYIFNHLCPPSAPLRPADSVLKPKETEVQRLAREFTDDVFKTRPDGACSITMTRDELRRHVLEVVVKAFCVGYVAASEGEL